MASSTSFSSYSALSFDIYGTLVDWENGIHNSLKPLISQLPSSHPASRSLDAVISDFNKHESYLMQNNPTMPYEEVLRRSAIALAEQWSMKITDAEAHAVGDSIRDWPAFPDTVAALQALSKKYKLIPLSNITHASFEKTKSGPLKDVKFDAVYVAEDIGSYKPDKQNFEFLLNGVQREFGVSREKLLHVAHGVRSDQVPAEEMGIAHVWIRRGKDNWGDVKKFDGQIEYETLGDFAKAVGCEL